MNEFLYSVEREYSVPLATLWQAWVEPTALEAWYSPTALSVLPGSVTSEAHEGGVWSAAVNVPEHNFVAYFFGRYSTVNPMNQLVHTMHYVESAEAFAHKDYTSPSHDVVIDFEDRGEKSWVKFSQFGQLPEGQAPQAQAGMESYFDNLGLYLAR